MKGLSIRARLVVVALVSFLSVALLGYLFVAQSLKDISFARQELKGVVYLDALLPDLFALAEGGARPPLDALDAVEAADADALRVADDTQLYREARSVATAPHDPALWDRAETLIARVADGSNLTLDPDLDSYYVMQMASMNIPAALRSHIRLEDILARRGAATGSEGDAELLAELGAFGVQNKAIANALDAAGAGPRGLQTVENLKDPVAAYGALADRLDGAIRDVMAGAGTNLASTFSQHLDVTAALYTAASAELKTLLSQRIDDLTGHLLRTLAIAGSLVALGFALTLWFASSIVRSVRHLSASIRAMAEDASATALVEATGRTEISDIARAVQYLRERTVDELQAAERQRLEQQERATETERQAAQQREDGLVRAASEANAQREGIAILSAALRQLSLGQLGGQIEQPLSGELETVRKALNETLSSLRQAMGQVKSSSTSIRTATSEILAGANDLAERTSRQAAMIQQTSQSMQELSRDVQESAQLAVEARQAGETVNRSTTATGAAMGETAEAMQRIQESSSRIAAVIGLIDDIAFQTNLLALNASVEAARAGDAGKGFAVVAVEVRRLAQSAAQSSAEIKALIEESRVHVGDGAKRLQDAMGLLEGMLEAANRNAGMLQQIELRSSRQSTAIEGIDGAVRSMDQSTQQNAALVEQVNAAIEQTEGQSNDLDRVVSSFRLEETGRAGRRAA